MNLLMEIVEGRTRLGPEGAQGRVMGSYCKMGSMDKIKIQNHSTSGGLWIIGWLFTIGYLKLAFWNGVLAFILWPYYLGVALSAVGQ